MNVADVTATRDVAARLFAHCVFKSRLVDVTELISSDGREPDVVAQALDDCNGLDKSPLRSSAPIEPGARCGTGRPGHPPRGRNSLGNNQESAYEPADQTTLRIRPLPPRLGRAPALPRRRGRITDGQNLRHPAGLRPKQRPYAGKRRNDAGGLARSVRRRGEPDA